MFRYLSLVKFAHTIFALPFALSAWFYAVVADGYGFSIRVLLLILLCMVAARNAAMGFNRWVDRRFDAANPRTASREIPAGRISVAGAAVFVAINAAIFIAAAVSLNPLAGWLSPLALGIVGGYSYAKRFTWASHFWLGMALAIAPVGAYIAVTGVVTLSILLLAALVLTWVGGFDILYALQDAAFDRASGLHSVPARFSMRSTLWISGLSHLASAILAVVLGVYIGASAWYWVGAGLFVGLLALQHVRVIPQKFASLNGISSLIFAAFFIIDLFF